MRVLFVEPLGHVAGHFSADTVYLVQAVANAGVDVTLLTFDGLLSNLTDLNARVTHIAAVSRIGAPARLVRRLFRYLPSRSVQDELDYIFSTICTFFQAFRQNREKEYDVIHILDAHIADYVFPWFASVVRDRYLVFTLHSASREVAQENWQARFRKTISVGQIMVSLWICLNRLLETRFVTPLRAFLYRRAIRTNRVSFVCYTDGVRDSYSASPFYETITGMFRGTGFPEAKPLAKDEAREHLGLPRDQAHFAALWS